MRVAVDTNVLIYVERLDDPVREARARHVIARLRPRDTVIPVQVLGELCSVLRRKARLDPAEIERSLDGWSRSGVLVGTSVAAFQGARQLVRDHGLQIWDACILSVAAEAGCGLLLSEDMQHGFSWRGVTIANPFLNPLPPLIDGVFLPSH